MGKDLFAGSANNTLEKGTDGFKNSESGITKLKLSLDVPLTLPYNYSIENSIKRSPQNEINLRQVRDLMNQFSGLVNSVVKRDFIVDEKMAKDTKIDNSFKDLKELTSLFTLLNALV
ncbi:unnamed protein product [[Candida] boidinii]|nr:unnamed protein product [[Candida] boidinii]